MTWGSLDPGGTLGFLGLPYLCEVVVTSIVWWRVDGISLPTRLRQLYHRMKKGCMCARARDGGDRGDQSPSPRPPFRHLVPYHFHEPEL